MIRQNSLGSLNSLSLSCDSDLEEKIETKAESDDEIKETFHRYGKIGDLTDLPEIKESICTKHYDEEGNKYYNEYKLISFLGSGAFSKIELVEKDGIKYALKIVDKSFLKSQKNFEFDEEGNVVVNTSLENAIKEISILKKTNHPNIIKLHEILYCEKNKNIYLVLEYCEHGDLVDYDEETGKFEINKFIREGNRRKESENYYSDEEILKFFIDIISGLYYLHSNGIIHHDIKPNNILLDKNNNCKITDFNISSILKNKDDDNVGKKARSTDHFKPPEACKINGKEGEEVDVKDLQGKPIDIWGLGVTLYILAYNKFPFESENNNIFELYEKINNSKIEFPDFPKRCRKIKCLIQKCLEKNPDKRITAERIVSKMDRNNNESIYKNCKKIVITQQDRFNSFNFLLSDCAIVFKNKGKRIFKKINNQVYKYRKYKGKIIHKCKDFCKKKIENMKEEGEKIIDKFFKGKDAPLPAFYKNHNKYKISKRLKLNNYKKYIIEDEKEKKKPKFSLNIFKKK